MKNSETYHSVLNQAKLFYEIQKHSDKTFTEIKARVERTFDEYIFFNHDTTHCILMLLEEHPDMIGRYPESFNYGHTRIILGELVNNKWKFEIGMEISFPPDDIEPLFPEEYENGVRHYTLTMLSQRARISVLNTGFPSLKNCDFDEQWWLKNQFQD